MAQKSEKPIIIAGGGIGGFAAALALSQKGRAVHLLEQAAEFGEVGAGIQIGPNVFKMFDVLGVTDAIREVAVFPENLIMRDAITGAEVARMPIGSQAFLDRYKYPYGVIYRPETELQSHYFDASLPRQFDEYIWFDETRAVEPLARKTGEALPDTFPFGI